MVDCTALERRHTEIPYRGFESLSFRQIIIPDSLRMSGIFIYFKHLQELPVYRHLRASGEIPIFMMGVMMVKSSYGNL